MTNNVTVNKNFSSWNDVASNNQRYTPEKLWIFEANYFLKEKETKNLS